MLSRLIQIPVCVLHCVPSHHEINPQLFSSSADFWQPRKIKCHWPSYSWNNLKGESFGVCAHFWHNKCLIIKAAQPGGEDTAWCWLGCGLSLRCVVWSTHISPVEDGVPAPITIIIWAGECLGAPFKGPPFSSGHPPPLPVPGQELLVTDTQHWPGTSVKDRGIELKCRSVEN